MVGRQGVFIGLGSKSLRGSVALVFSVLSEAVELEFLVLLALLDSETLAGRQEQFRIRQSREEA
jgi:hypothetical protein